MDVPGPSRRRCREDAFSNARNVRSRCPTQDLVQSRRRRREEAAAATLAAPASAASVRNVRARLPLSNVSLCAPAAAASVLKCVSAAPRRYTVLSELASMVSPFFPDLGSLAYMIEMFLIFRRPFLSTCACNHCSAE